VEVTRAQDVARAKEIEFWINQVAITWNVLPMDARVICAWARLMVGRQDELIGDRMIAAVAVVQRLIDLQRKGFPAIRGGDTQPVSVVWFALCRSGSHKARSGNTVSRNSSTNMMTWNGMVPMTTSPSSPSQILGLRTG
jgi:hypothetical protein